MLELPKKEHVSNLTCLSLSTKLLPGDLAPSLEYFPLVLPLYRGFAKGVLPGGCMRLVRGFSPPPM